MLYHATFLPRLKSIVEHGLGGNVTEVNFPISIHGHVCLTDNYEKSKKYASQAVFNRDITFNLRDIIVLSVNESDLNEALLITDPNIHKSQNTGHYSYLGIIPEDKLNLELREVYQRGRDFRVYGWRSIR